MKKTITITVVLLVFSLTGFSQKYLTKNGSIKFFSEAPMETIEAINKQVNCALDSKTGDFVFKVLIKSFEFEKAMMQEHFNENYMHSDEFPNATFVGKVTNIKDYDFAEGFPFEAIIEGDLTIKGKTNKVSEIGIFEVRDAKIHADAVFPIKLSDYGVKIPGTVVDNISETVEITVDIKLVEFNK
ncbi:MAG: YceI family protein [Bacteroidota bacterium]|nr:YceI family protein [Bacteroidota bacterium]